MTMSILFNTEKEALNYKKEHRYRKCDIFYSKRFHTWVLSRKGGLK